jgi:hypothetical protein
VARAVPATDGISFGNVFQGRAEGSEAKDEFAESAGEAVADAGLAATADTHHNCTELGRSGPVTACFGAGRTHQSWTVPSMRRL